MPVTVLISDDSAVMRKAVKIFLSGRTDVAIVGEATNGAETIAGLRDLRPDVLLLDLRIPGFQNQPLKLGEQIDHTKIVAMTFGKDEASRALADYIGASVLIDKADLTTELIPLVVGLAQKSFPRPPEPIPSTF